MCGPISWIHFNFNKFNFLVSKFFISLSKFQIVIHFYFEHISTSFLTILQRGDRFYFTSSYIFYDSVRQKTNLQLAVTFIGQSQTLRIEFLFHSPLHFLLVMCFQNCSSEKHLATKLVIINIIDLEINVFIHNYFTTDELGMLRSSDTQYLAQIQHI